MSVASVDTRLDPGDVPVVVRHPPAEPPPSGWHPEDVDRCRRQPTKEKTITVHAVQPNTRSQSG